MKIFSFRKSRRILRNGFKLYQKKSGSLTEMEKREFELDLRALDTALLNKNKEESSKYAQLVENFSNTHFKKTFFDHVKEIGYALCFAIVVAFLIRGFWFELYEVPTGSMRPTVEELDRMIVSKTTFGINFPFRKKPVLFSDDYIKRGGTVVLTVQDMDVSDADMLYFNIFPGKKRFIKRSVSKPGDTLYFYGGHVYSVDKEGKPVLTLADEASLKEMGIEKIDHVPYITFDGKTKVSHPASRNIFTTSTLNQMNEPVGKLEVKSKGHIEGTFFNGKEWIPDRVDALKEKRESPASYSDLWGIGNYAMARILTKEQLQLFYHEVPSAEDAKLYLELRHTPNLSYPKPELRQNELGIITPMITPFVSIIPLNKEHLSEIQQALYTARFVVKNGSAYRYHESKRRPQRMEYDIKFPSVPDGKYEFYYGVGYKVHISGFRTKLPKDHPLYSSSPDNIRKLFNLGLAFNTFFEPTAPNQPYNPQRFAYYRNGDLFVMGAPIFKKEDTLLTSFVENEIEKQKSSSKEKPYIAFVDHGPPLKEDGSVDVEFIKAFGLKVPEDAIVGLGDNYAMSADSRDFGFIPVENLRGSASFTFWPLSHRIGSIPQNSYPWFTLPNMIVWTIAAIIGVLTLLYRRKRNQRSIFSSKDGKTQKDLSTTSRTRTH